MEFQNIPNSKSFIDGFFLFTQSDDHRIYTVSEVLSYLVYPILHGKIKIFYEDDKPVGLVTWCFLSEEKGRDFVDDRHTLTEEDYLATDGEELWAIEVIAPFGHVRPIIKAMSNLHRDTYGTKRVARWRRFKNRHYTHKGVF